VPTAEEFRAAAGRYRDVATEAGSVRTELWTLGGDHGVLGGQLEVVVDRSIAAGALNSTQLATECEGLAAVCDDRATTCEEYAAALSDHRRRHRAWNERRLSWQASLDSTHQLPPPGPEPVEPRRPAPWVEL
jgi:hypothetical protein